MKFEPLPDFVVCERDFSEAVAALYGRPYKLQQMELMGNNTYLTFEVTPEHYNATTFLEAQVAVEAWQAEWEALKSTDDRFKEMHAERDHFIDLELLTINMWERGELSPGSYLMKVSW